MIAKRIVSFSGQILTATALTTLSVSLVPQVAKSQIAQYFCINPQSGAVQRPVPQTLIPAVMTSGSPCFALGSGATLNVKGQTIGEFGPVTAAPTPATRPPQTATVARANGRCKFTALDTVMYDGHCIMKQKVADRVNAYIITLDNGVKYRFYGQGKFLKVETEDGVHTAVFRDKGDRGVFEWEGNKLVAIQDSYHDPAATVDQSQPSQAQSLQMLIQSLIK
jgi:hypothetical protein